MPAHDSAGDPAPAGRATAAADPATLEVSSFCRICAAACGIVVTVDGNRVIAVRGDRTDPESAGYSCPKGRSLPELHHHPLRLDHPRCRGEVVSWDRALDDLAGTLRSIVTTSDSGAIGMYLGTGLAFDTAGWSAAMAAQRTIPRVRLYTPATIDNAPVLLAARLVAGHPQANPVVCFDRAAVVLIVGSNPVVSHGYGTAFSDPVRRLRAVMERGGEVWVVDPRRTETAAIATRHLRPLPGSDVELLAHLVRRVVDSNATDGATAVDPHERSQLRAALDDFTVERCARSTGLPVDELRDLGDVIVARPGALAAWCGTGVTMGPHGALAEWLRWVLLAVHDSLDRETGMTIPRGALFAMRARRAQGPSSSVAPGPDHQSGPESWLGQEPCVTLVDAIESGAVRALIVAGANPLAAFPDVAATRRALQRLDVLAVVDVVESELTAIATHVLASRDQLERADTTMHELVMATTRPRYTPPIVTANAHRRPAWWIFAEITRRATDRELFVGENVSTDDDVLACVTARGRVSFGEVRIAGPHGLDSASPAGWYRDEGLADGHWHIASAVMLDRLAVLARREYVAPTMALIPHRRMRANNSVADPRTPDPGPPEIGIAPADADALGFGAGDRVRVSNGNGEVTGTLVLDDRLARGVVTLAHGDPRCSPGDLVSRTTDVDPLTGMPRAAAVGVDRIEAP